ncbi:MAG: hypothetical protein EZS28_054969, partial [Streblomastix strix]
KCLCLYQRASLIPEDRIFKNQKLGLQQDQNSQQPENQFPLSQKGLQQGQMFDQPGNQPFMSIEGLQQDQNSVQPGNRPSQIKIGQEATARESLRFPWKITPSLLTLSASVYQFVHNKEQLGSSCSSHLIGFPL